MLFCVVNNDFDGGVRLTFRRRHGLAVRVSSHVIPYLGLKLVLYGLDAASRIDH